MTAPKAMRYIIAATWLDKDVLEIGHDDVEEGDPFFDTEAELVAFLKAVHETPGPVDSTKTTLAIDRGDGYQKL